VGQVRLGSPDLLRTAGRKDAFRKKEKIMAGRGWVKVAHVGLAGLCIGLGVSGCGSKEVTPTADASHSGTTAAVSVGSGEESDSNGATGAPRLQQSFSEATLAEPPEGTELPPAQTVSGKSVGKLYKQVVSLWDEIRFTTADGRKITYTATIETEIGTITLELYPEMAPNHVRNFVALARAGYYDGLVFERTIHEDVEDSEFKRDIIEAGCPTGTGDAGFGSIGYWLKPELADTMVHEEGVLGSCHSEQEDGGACRFYINLRKAPYLDGQYTVFGKVTQGLDVARKILSLPVRTDGEYPEGDRPIKPVVMKKVTITVAGEAIASK
jgi:peptidyl-prolyl cis-trans isomerase B (cyclophilin B)